MTAKEVLPRARILKVSALSLAFSALAATGSQAATVTLPALVLQSSEAQVIVESNADAPKDKEQQIDPNFASVQSSALGGFGSGNATTGELKLSTATDGLRNFTLNPLNITNTVDVTLKYVFANPGTADFTIQPGALRYTIDGSMQRNYIDPNSVGVGTQRFTTQLLASLTLSGATSGTGSINVNAVGNASELTIGADPTLTPNPPNSALQNMVSNFTQADGDAVEAVIANKDAIIVGGGQTLTIRADIRGKAITQFGPNPTCVGTGTGDCLIGQTDLSNIGASVDALNTGRLSLIVPDGTVIGGFASSPTWITTESPLTPVPLPASLTMMVASLTGFGLLRLRRRRGDQKRCRRPIYAPLGLAQL